MPGERSRVAIVGTFDVENFGDVLFPLIARHELEARIPGIDVVPYSYHRRDEPSWPYGVRSLTRLADDLSSIDLVIVGGGHLVRFDKSIAPGYAPPVEALHHPTGYWLMPTLLASWLGIPVAWNAVGVSRHTPGWAVGLLAETARSVDYLAVRDVESAEELERVARRLPVEQVPDTAFGAASLLDHDSHAAADRLRVDLRLAEPYVVVQPSIHFLEHKDWVESLVEEARAAGRGILELPVSPCLGDTPGMLDLGDTVRPSRWPTPLELLELVRGADAVIARSLHLTIAAACLGVPAHRHAADPDSKYEIVTGLPGVHVSGADSVAESRLFLGHSHLSAEVAARQHHLARHWDRVAALVGTTPTGGRSRLQAMIAVLTELAEQESDAPAGQVTSSAVLRESVPIKRG